MKKLIIIFGLLSVLVGNQAEAITIKEYEEFRKIDEYGADMYLSGIAEGLVVARAGFQFYNQGLNYIDLFCAPDNIKIGRDLARAALQTYKDANRGDDVFVGFGVAEGLSIMFPCN